MLCQSLTVGGTLGLKAVAFGQFWAENMNDAALKAAAQYGILSMGDKLTDDPVYRENNEAFVVFLPSTVKYTELGILNGIKAILGALYTWAKANPGKLLALVGVTTLTYLAIRVVDWQTKVQEAGMSEDDTAKDILNNTTLTGQEKLKLLMEYLGIKGDQGTNWADMIIPAVALLSVAYVARGMFEKG